MVNYLFKYDIFISYLINSSFIIFENIFNLKCVFAKIEALIYAMHT